MNCDNRTMDDSRQGTCAFVVACQNAFGKSDRKVGGMAP